MGLFGFMLFLFGIICVFVSSIGKKKNARCTAQTQGTLMEIYEGDGSEGGTEYTYTYSYSVNGNTYKLESKTRSKEVNNTGDNCTIWYNPSKPGEAQPFHYESGRIYKNFFIIGIVTIVLGVLLILF